MSIHSLDIHGECRINKFHLFWVVLPYNKSSVYQIQNHEINVKHESNDEITSKILVLELMEVKLILGLSLLISLLLSLLLTLSLQIFRLLRIKIIQYKITK